jgi:bifunctional DNA-binding transcriptional regulator/antitoxin component of YhaV-PrlF toxin-antitoxin module
MSNTSVISDADVRIGNRYQITVPKSVLKAFSLQEGDFLKWTIVRGGIKVTPMRLTEILSDQQVSRMESALRSNIASGNVTLVVEAED